MRDTDNLVSGPASVTLGGSEIGHTQGGVSVSVQPQFRERVVDEFGDTAIDLIHQGDEVRLNVPWAEWTSVTIGAAYEPGATGSGSGTYFGIGRKAGYIYTDQVAEIIPLLAVDAGKKIVMHRVTAIGQFELNFVHSEDRIFNVEHACLADQSQPDGETIGQVHYVAA